MIMSTVWHAPRYFLLSVTLQDSVQVRYFAQYLRGLKEINVDKKAYYLNVAFLIHKWTVTKNVGGMLERIY